MGFGGDNGLCLNADQVKPFHSNPVAGLEGNYRLSSPAYNHVELILGLRYFYAQETVGIFTNDDLFVTNVSGLFDPKLAATYRSTVRNNLVDAQFGGEFSAPCPIPYFGWQWFTGIDKAA